MPVLAPKNQSMVSRETRDASLANMIGVPHQDDDGEKEKLARMAAEQLSGDAAAPQAVSAERALVASCLKKRKLYKQLSGTDVPWFPHDNDMELLKECCWESGRPRWVIFGTPAGGAGMHGCLEMGTSVVALCSDDHHREVLNRCMMERAVETMVVGATVVFKDDNLRTSAIYLNLAPETPKKGDDEDFETPKKETKKDKKDKKEDNKKDKKDQKKGKKDHKDQKKDKKDKKKASSSSSSSKETSASSDSTSPTKKKKTK